MQFWLLRAAIFRIVSDTLIKGVPLSRVSALITDCRSLTAVLRDENARHLLMMTRQEAQLSQKRRATHHDSFN